MQRACTAVAPLDSARSCASGGGSACRLRRPAGHVAAARPVRARRGMDEREFEDANAATQLLPGPPRRSWRSLRRPGRRGRRSRRGRPRLRAPRPRAARARRVGAAGGAAGLDPGRRCGRRRGGGRGRRARGGQLAGASVLGRRRALGRAAFYAVVGAVATLVAGPWVVLALLGCGLAELALRRGGAALHAGRGPRARRHGAQELPALAWTALKVGALSYGGGFVIVPLMESDAVREHDWMSHVEFLNAWRSGSSRRARSSRRWRPSATPRPAWAARCWPPRSPSCRPSSSSSRRWALRATALQRGRASVPRRGRPAAVGAVIGAAVVLVDGVREPWQAVVLAAAGLALLSRRRLEHACPCCSPRERVAGAPRAVPGRRCPERPYSMSWTSCSTPAARRPAAARRSRRTRRRWPRGCGRGRWTRSSARSTCSARAARCAPRSSTGARTRWSSTGRPARARRRSRGSSPRAPTRRSRS